MISLFIICMPMPTTPLAQGLYPAKGFGLLVHDVGRMLRRRIDQRAQALGLTSAQWRVLSSLARAELLNHEPLHQAALADEMDMEPITLSRLIDRMQAAHLVERRPDPGDRRAHRLFLTEAARPLVSQFRSVASECLSSALAGVSEVEIDLVTDVLTRVRANLVGRADESAPAAGTKSRIMSKESSAT
jgi:MarR family transcriptional regulator, transcriptional regulator for hemolysin